MKGNINDYELANAIAKKYPKGKTPIYSVPVDVDEAGNPQRVDFENGPFYVLDETEEDYGLKADAFINASVPENTQRAYIGDIQYFTQWLIHSKIVTVIGKDTNWPVSEETVIKFIFHHLEEMPIDVENSLIASGWKRKRGNHSLATVKRRLVSLSILHKMDDKPDPCLSKKVKDLLFAMSKTRGKQTNSKAITRQILENMLQTCSKNSLIDLRDKALLLFGWASGGRRRSEISDAILKNIEETVEGDFIYHIDKSKTDQTGKGFDVPVKGPAAMALRAWIKASGIKEGSLFRSISKGGEVGKNLSEVDINRIVKKRAEKAGYDASEYSAHGLRRGFVTEAGRKGCPLGDVMAMTGHRSVNIAMKYYESGAAINNKAADILVS